MSQRTRYRFEHALPMWRPYGKPEGFYKEFLGNLHLGSSTLGPGATALLERYVANVHVNCSWYNHNVRSEKLLQALFFLLSVALLVLVPLVVYFSPSILDWIGTQVFRADLQLADEFTVGELTARLTTLLAGFFAAHRTISAWLNQRKLIAPFWKARSDLLNEIYTLETEWGPKEATEKVGSDNSLVAAFKQAIEASLESARSIVQNERAQYYTNYTFPDVNLPVSLSEAGTAASALVTMFESPSVKQQRESAKAREAHARKHDDLKAEVAGLTAILAEWKVDLGVKKTERDQETDPTKKQEKEAEIAAIVAEIAKLRTQQRLKIEQQAQEGERAGLVGAAG